MRGSDYVVKRIAYAILTVFIAITLNFVLFRALSGDAVSALRCKQCSKAFKEAQRRDLGPRRGLAGPVQARGDGAGQEADLPRLGSHRGQRRGGGG